MTGQAAAFIGSIPEIYDSVLGPIIFMDYALDIAKRAAQHRPARVLETAAGTGIVSRQLRDALPVTAALTVTDLNPPMLAWAKRKFRENERVSFEPADAMALPFGDGSFDAVVCQFGVMFYPDKDKGYREVSRVLAPGGRYHFSVWDSHRHNPFGRIAHETIGSFFPSDPPGFYKVPFGYHAVDPIKSSLEAAGFTDIAIHVVPIDKNVPDVALFARGVVYGNPVFDQIKARGGAGPEAVHAKVTEVLTREFGGSPGRARLQAIVIEARKP